MSTAAVELPRIATLAFYPKQKPGYRLYALWHFMSFMVLWHLVGQTFLGFEQAWAHPILTIGTACLTQWLLEWIDAKVNKRTPRYAGGIANFLNFFPPAVIVGGALGMLLYPNELIMPAIFASVVSIGSKVVVRVTLPNGLKHHIFNPSNFGICATLLLFPDVVGMAPPYHFTENLVGAWHWGLPALILCSGLFLHYNATGRLPLCITWLLGFAAQAIVRSWIDGNAWYVSMMPMSSAAFIIFTLYMIPDPATTPLVWWRQVLFAGAVAAVYGVLLTMHIVFGLFLALFIVCLVRGVCIELYTRVLQRRESDMDESPGRGLGMAKRMSPREPMLPAHPVAVAVETGPTMFSRLRIPGLLIGILAIVTILHLWLNIGFAKVFSTRAESKFRVGFLPVTCHLTCPVTDWINKNMTGEGFYQPRKFSGWPEIKESLLSGDLPCTFLLAPLAMKLVEDGAPVKVVYLGHRDGTAIVVHIDSDIRTFEDLEGKTIAVPNRFSNQYLIFYKALRDRGMKIGDIIIKEMPPPDMPAALAARQVDAITSGEPFMAQAELQGYGRVLYQARDLWPNFISCTLVVRDEMIRDHPDKVQKLVDGIAKSGKWIDASMEHRLALSQAVATQYYNQDPQLLRFVLTKTPDRVTYTKLSLAKDDFDEIMELALEANILKRPLKFEAYTDTRFSEKTHGATPQSWEPSL
ncbi:MAG: ABC transporter substrate-binding protein [Pirellulales bacterium]